MKPTEEAPCQRADRAMVNPPKPLNLENSKAWREYEWPELNVAKPAIGLQIEIEQGLVFPTPRGRIIGTYEAPARATAWGWHIEKSTWVNLMEFGGFLPKFSHITFVPSTEIVTAMTSIIFLEIFPTEWEIKSAFPDNVREWNPNEPSIMDELNLAPFITIHSCRDSRTIKLYEEGHAFVEITVPRTSANIYDVPAAIEPGKKAARDLAEARARRKLAIMVAFTVSNAKCPDDCNFPVGTPSKIISNLTHDREESIRADDDNIYIDWYSRHVASVSLELTCKSPG